MSANYDLIIIGAGPAGIGAGVAAINSGLRTLLVHSDPEIGGQATNIYVGTICGVHSRFLSEDNLVGNFPRDFTRQLAKRSNSTVVINSMGLSYLPYKREAYLELSTEMLHGKGIEVKNNTIVSKVDFDGHSLSSLEISNGRVTQEVQAPLFIDCSGNGILSILGKGELIEEEEYQYTSIVVGLSGIIEKEEAVLKLDLYKVLEEAFRQGLIKVGGRCLNFVHGTTSTYPDTTYFKFSSFIHTNSYDNEIELLNEVLKYLRTKDSFSDLSIEFLSKRKGIRSSCRPLGVEILSDKMVLNAAKSTDTIARGIWPVELWKGPTAPIIEHLKDDGFYDIPYTCLQSKSFNNLLSAGRALSCEEKAHSSARVIGTSLQTGHAAGFLARNIIEGLEISKAVATYQGAEGLR